jgi:hypothetical protein
MYIKNRITNEVIYHSDHKTMKETLEAAVQAKVNLSYVDLQGADLSYMNLPYAYLLRVNLFLATLFQANLLGTTLREANLEEANLEEANLFQANLEGANLEEANLRGANLRGANLRRTSLVGAKSLGVNLKDTCLDPDAQLPTLSDEEIIKAGLEIDGEWVYGWRTKQSQMVGDTIYEPGVYTASVFSVDTETSCHPGIYIAGEKWLKDNYSNTEIVRCRCRRIELLHAGDKWRCSDKWRCKQLEVLK